MASSDAERPFIGRIEALDVLRRKEALVLGGHGGVTVIEGDPGVGKSTLVAQVVRDGRTKGMLVVETRAVSLENPPPLALIREALFEAARVHERERTGDIGPTSLAFVPPNTSDSVLIGFAPGADTAGFRGPAVEERLLEVLAGPGESSTASRGRLFATLTGEFLAIAQRTPTLLVLEDLHLADEASLECLTLLASQAESAPLWIVGTALSPANLPEPRRGLLERLKLDGHAEAVHVRPFTHSETVDFVNARSVTGPVSAEDVTRWHSQTGGNPLFLEQLIRSRRSAPTPPTGPPGEEVAPELTEYLVRRLPELSDAEQRVMTVASILGREFPFQLLLQASDVEEEQLTEVVEHLVEVGVLRETPREGLAFVRDDFRGQLYQTLTDAHRRLLHRRAGEALESIGGADPATIYALARHFYLGRVDEKSMIYNRIAAEFAARSFSPSVARTHLEHALESHRRLTPTDHAGEVEMTLELAIQLDRLGELKTAEKVLTEVIRAPHYLAAASPSQRAFVQIYLARILTDQGLWDEADRMSADLVDSPDVQAGVGTQIAVHRLRGEIQYYKGEYLASLRHHDTALALCREQHNARETALEAARRANVLGMIPGRLEEAVRDYRASIEELKRLGDDAEAAFTLIYLGVVLSQHDRVDEGLPALEEAEVLAQRAHDLRRVGWALFNIADLKRDKGRLPEAIEANQRSRRTLERVGDRFGLVQTYIIEGKIRLATGEFDAAEVELLEAYRMVRELRTAADEVEVLLRLAEVALAKHDVAAARSRVEEIDRRDVPRIRPDLVQDLLRLKDRLAEGAVG